MKLRQLISKIKDSGMNTEQSISLIEILDEVKDNTQPAFGDKS